MPVLALTPAPVRPKRASKGPISSRAMDSVKSRRSGRFVLLLIMRESGAARTAAHFRRTIHIALLPILPHMRRLRAMEIRAQFLVVEPCCYNGVGFADPDPPNAHVFKPESLAQQRQGLKYWISRLHILLSGIWYASAMRSQNMNRGDFRVAGTKSCSQIASLR
jgi:hypothetical protein